MADMDSKPLPEGVQRVVSYLESHGHPHAPVMLSDAARTAQQAADGLGVQLGQIAKSIIFRRESDGVPVLVVTSGDRRVDVARVQAQVGPVGRADAAFVKTSTGFSIGGVAPVAHAQPCVTLVDVDLFRFDTIWAAAGHPHAVFPLSPAQLCAMVQAPPGNVVEGVVSKIPAEARVRLAERAQAVRKLDGPVPSPCMSVCTMDAERAFCVGCLRSIEEIRAWSRQDDAGRRQTWQRIEERLDRASA